MPETIRGKFGSAPGVKDLGVLDVSSGPVQLDLSGVVGSQSGAATVFYDFETTAPSRVAVFPKTLNHWTTPLLQWFIRRLDDGTARMEENLEMVNRPRQGEGVVSRIIEPGKFRLTIGTQSWYSIPYATIIQVRAESEIEAESLIEILPEARFNQSLTRPFFGLEVEVEASFTRSANIGTVVYPGYVVPGYWEAGYAVGDAESLGSGVVGGLGLEVTVALETVSPAVL
jgi:hypothetical protein